ncbi:MAG: transcription termination/antitermination protein NusG [Deltaproteobacteria bacterium]|nr:transcription termination/antitermination protein NusG [Deltaproteobacteria bacterium]
MTEQTNIPDDLKHQWYILQTYSGFENRVKQTLEEKLKLEKLEHLVEEVLVPGEDVTRVKNGKKRKVHVIYFPGYLLIKMHLTDELWHVLMNIPRVSGFVGGKSKNEPHPLEESELTFIRSQMDKGIAHTVVRQEFEVGEQVIVIDGPFANFSGKVDEVNLEKHKLRVLISILGRSTPVELDFDKVKTHPDNK